MHPSHDQIATAAYHRWQRRGSRHGRDQEDWTAAENDLTFALNYRWVARFTLSVSASIGKADGGRPRRCRFCEQSEPAASFAPRPLPLPEAFRCGALLVCDECDDCRAHQVSSLAGPFESFTRRFLATDPRLPAAGETIPIAALKALVRTGLSVLPAAELQHFGDTFEWVANPDHARDAPLARHSGLGCRVYVTATPMSSPFVSLARRTGDDVLWPYILVFLAAGRVILQTHLPFCPRDEDLDDVPIVGPVLSISTGEGEALRASLTAFLPVATRRNVSHAYGDAPAPVRAAASNPG